MPDFNDMISAYHSCLAQVESWRVQFEPQFFAPVAEDMLRRGLASLPPEQLATLQQAEPEAFDKMMEFLGGG